MDASWEVVRSPSINCVIVAVITLIQLAHIGASDARAQQSTVVAQRLTRSTISVDNNRYRPPVDCNHNGFADHFEVAHRLVADCNDNGIADECEQSPNLPELQVQNPIPVGRGVNDVVAADFDLDGDSDLSSVDYVDGTLTILLNDGIGGFGEHSRVALGGAPHKATVIDINRDGWPDLAVTDLMRNLVIIVENQQSPGRIWGGFVPVSVLPTVGLSPTAITSGDFNLDGWVDLAVVCFDTNNIDVFLHRGTVTGADGYFIPPTSYDAGPVAFVRDLRPYGPLSIVAADLNEDGFLDLVVADGISLYPPLNPYQLASTIVILLNDELGHFQPQVIERPECENKTVLQIGRLPTELIAADYNRDTFIDIAAISLGSRTVTLLINEGRDSLSSNNRDWRGLESPTVPTTPDDQCVEVFNSARQLGPYSGYPYVGKAGDLNADDNVDMVIAFSGVPGSTKMKLALNRGQRGQHWRGLEDSIEIPLGDIVGSYITAVNLVDIDRDNLLDIIVANMNQPIAGNFQTGGLTVIRNNTACINPES